MEGILELLSAHVGPWAFVLLVACGLGLPPWSEELVTVGVGHFVAQGDISFPSALIWCWGGLLAGDSAVFWLGEFAGERVYRWPLLRRHLSPRRRHRFNRFFLKHGTWAVFTSRFVPGLRIIAYFVAGNLRMPFWKFFLLDSFGAAIYAPAGVFLGYFFSGNLDKALIWLRGIEIPLAIFAVLGIFLLVRSWGRRRKARLQHLLQIREARRKARRARHEAGEGREQKPPSTPTQPAAAVGGPGAPGSPGGHGGA